MSEQSPVYQGSCLCQGIRYEIQGEIGEIVQCHCQRCRKANGTAYATNAPISSRDFKIVEVSTSLKNLLLQVFIAGFVGNVVHHSLAHVMRSQNCIV